MARRLRVVASLLSAVLVASTVAPAFAQAPPDPKALLADGDKAGKDKNWKKALESYEASNKAQPSQPALAGVAAAHYNLGNLGAAYVAYGEWLKLYGASQPARKKDVEARLKELEGKTSLVTISVSPGDGAAIAVDDASVGTAPLAAPLRLAPGTHRIHVTKEGYLPFDATVTVLAGTPATVDAKLEAQSTKGRLVVREKTGKQLRVLVDDVDMGETTWAGEVAAGPHRVAGRGAGLLAPPSDVIVERGKTHEVELTAATTISSLKITTSDGKGLIHVDDKVVGEGSYSSDLVAGAHKIKITREGYETFEEEVVLKANEPLSRTITLTLGTKIETGTIEKTSRLLEGIYGGLQLGGALMPGGNGNSPQKSCEQGQKPPELVDCDVGSNAGANFGGFLGYHWDPVGVELFLSGGYDQQSPFLRWNRSGNDPGIGPDPARREEFTVRRVGGLGALRVRLTLGGSKLRFTLAGGVGLSVRAMFMVRDTTSTTDPTLPADKAVADGLTYTSPVLSLEPAAVLRLSPTLGVFLGFAITLENPRVFSDNPRSTPESNHRLGPSGLTTPAYDLASGTQTYLGLNLGVMFGP